MMQKINEELNRKFIELWEKDKKEYFDEIFSSNFEHHYHGVVTKGKENYIKFYSSFFSNYKTIKFFIDKHYNATENASTYRWHAHGVFSKNFQGKQLEEIDIEFSGLTFVEVNDGKIASVWTYDNLLDMELSAKISR